MKPLVSILVPAYNAEAWISDALRSAIAQTWKPKEIIVVDDGSTDGTLAVARQFESNQLRVVTHKNQGASATRNKAYSLCKGDYIQFLDADDLIGPDKIAKQIAGSVAIERAGTLERSVEAASLVARAGDVVLLAPACASFDQFENYEQRGRVFKELVRGLEKGN